MDVPQWIVDVLDSVFVPPPPKVIRYCPMCGIKQETTPETIGYCDLVFCEKCEPKVKEYAAFINSYQSPPLHHLQYEALRKTVYKYNSITGEELNP